MVEPSAVWEVLVDDEGEAYVKSPTGHKFWFGDMEFTDGCCFDEAQYIVDSCNAAREVRHDTERRE